MRPLRALGFTLIEVLVAVLIFGFIAVAAYSALNSAQTTQAMLKTRGERFHELSRAINQFTRDYRQVATRRIRDSNGEVLPVLRARSDGRENFIEFTRSGWRNPARLPRSTLEHVIYRLESEQLVRYSYTMLDQATASKPNKQILVDGVKKFELRFFNGENLSTQFDGSLNTEQWPKEWPLGGGLNQDDAARIPAAIKVVFDIEGLGEIYRVLP